MRRHRITRSTAGPALLLALAGCCAERVDSPSEDPPVVASGPAVTPAPAVIPVVHSSYAETVRGAGASFEMIWIEAGGFWIGKTEVTWDEYLPYCDFEEAGVPPGVDAVSKPSKPLETFPYDRDWGTGRRPAVGMSWNAAKKYCQWLSINTGVPYRLPTEKEWQLACGGAPAGPLGDYAWYDDNSSDKTQEVAGKLPNEHGLHDMLGNLWEYCLDPYDPAEPEWPALRGGSWADSDKDASPTSRLKFDDFWNLADPNVPPGTWWVPDGDHVGFRVVRLPGETLNQGQQPAEEN